MFDWKTDETEEKTWPEPTSPIPPQRRLPPWLWLAAAALLIVAVATWLIVREIDRRAEVGQENIKADVLASHQVIYDAVLAADTELFIGFLSGRDDDWALVQERLVFSQRLWRGDQFGFTWLPQDAATAVQEIQLSDDLLTAELTQVQQYAIDAGNGVTETIQLEQTVIYRLGENRWLLAPPDEEFWGATITRAERFVTAVYNGYDADVNDRLVPDIDAKIDELCAMMQPLSCPPDFALTLQFEHDPALLLDPITLAGDIIRLPAPSLVGLPVDEAGYQALFRSYASQVATAMITEITQYECCLNQQLYQALLDIQLRRLALKPQPDLSETYAQLVQDGFQLADGRFFWGITDPSAQTVPDEVVAIVADFMVNEMGVAIPELQQSIMMPTSYFFWLELFLQPSLPTQAEQEQAWLRYLLAHLPQQTLSDDTYPQQVLRLICQTPAQPAPMLVRYDLQTAAVVAETDLPLGAFFLYTTSDDEQTFVSSRAVADDRREVTELWDGATLRPLPELAAGVPTMAIPTLAGPDGQLLLHLVTPRLTPYGLLSPADCAGSAASCAVDGLSGYPIWSPDGSKSVLMLRDATSVLDESLGGAILLLNYTSDPAGTQLGFGSAPFWLSNEEIGYLVEDGGFVREAVRVPLTAEGDVMTERPLLSTDLLALALPDADVLTLNALNIDFIQVNPTAPDELFVVTSLPVAGSESSGYLFVYDMAAATVRQLFSFAGHENAYQRGLRLTADGRYLQIMDTGTSAATLYLIDTGSYQSQSYTFFDQYPDTLAHWYLDWSADGEWLVMVERGFFHLIAPAARIDQTVVIPNADCHAANWINKP